MKKLSLIYLISITIIAGAILASSKVLADDSVVSQVSISVPTACTMSGTGMNSHTANVNNGTYTPNIGTTTLQAFCNDANGFAIYAVGYTDNEFGKNVLTSSTLGASHDIATGTAESGNTSNWAMKLAKTQDSGDTSGTNAFTIDNSFGNYHAVPSAYTKVAHKNTATDMDSTTGGVKLTTTYAVLISANQAAGTYTGQVKYTLVHPASETPLQPQPALPGRIIYHPNGYNVVGTMGQQFADYTTEKLRASNFSRSGYGFAGWSTTFDYSDPTGLYGPNETINIPSDISTNGLSLYAIWIESAGAIQNWSGCPSLAQGAITALTDRRDNDTYAIAKLADGNCWMIENLRLGNTNSDNSAGALAQGYSTSTTYGNFSGLANPESQSLFNLVTTANSLYYSGIQDGTATIDIGTTDNPEYRFPRYNNINIASRESSATGIGNTYSYGNYYTWHAAIASLIPNTTNNQSTTSTSLCPAGWHLPIGGSPANAANSEFWKLSSEIMGAAPSNNSNYSNDETNTAGDTASIAFRKYPNNFVDSGYINMNSISDRGSSGSYLSSTAWASASNSTFAYGMTIDTSYVRPGTDTYAKSGGASIRCLISGI